jgi:hypothetical protein
MARAEAAWRETLSAVTLANLVTDMMAHIDPRALEKSAPWLQDHVRGLGRTLSGADDPEVPLPPSATV